MFFVVVFGTNCMDEIRSDRSRAQGALGSEWVDWSGLRKHVYIRIDVPNLSG